MLELAIAEAYRPRPRPRRLTSLQQPPPTASPRPATFATNPNARASISSLRPRTPSALSRSTSVSSQSRSFISFLARRKRPDSICNDRTITPHDAARADSVFSQETATAATHVLLGSKEEDDGLSKLSQTTATPSTHAFQFSKSPARSLPTVPPPVPLPPQEELHFFDTALQSVIEDLQSSHPLSQERDLALRILEHMSHISNLSSCVATCWPEFFAMLLHSTKLIISVLPAKEVGTRNLLVSCLAGAARRWNEEKRRETAEIAGIVGEVFEEAVKERKSTDKRLGKEFARWLGREHNGFRRRGRDLVRILTLGVSTAMLVGLQYALAENADLEIRLSVLTALDRGLPPPPSYERLRVNTHSTSAIDKASQNADVLLLETSCIYPGGDVQCQNRAPDTAACVKTLSPLAKIVVLGDIHDIASSVVGRQAANEITGGIEEPPELVSAKFLDVYVTDVGIMKVEDLGRLAVEAKKLDRVLLGEASD
jgi:hypothetical protein